MLAVASAAVLALGVAACGSSDSSSSSGAARARARQRRKVGGTINGAGSTFAAPDLPAVGARPQGARALTVNYQAVGSGGGIAQFTAGTVDFGAHRPGDEATRRSPPPRRRATPVHIPIVLRRDHGLLQRHRRRERASSSTARRSPTSSSARSRSGTTRRSPSQNSGVKLPEHGHHGRATAPTSRARRRASRSSWPTTRPSGRAAPASTRRSSGRPAPAPRATTASPPRSSRPTARSATSSRPTRCRTTSRTPTVKNKVGQVRRADARRRPRRPARASRSRTTCASATIDAPGADGLPDRVADVPARLPGPVQGRASSEDTAKRVKDWLDYALGDGPERRAKQLQYAPLPDAHPDARRRPRSTACSATAAPISELADGSREHSHAPAAAARSSSGRRAPALPDPLLRWGLTGARRGDPAS